MSDEIKEILLIIKSCKQDYDKQKDGMHTFDYGELYLLFNYITNLQQKEELLRQEISDVRKAFNGLQQENERLKETNVYCNRTDCVGRIKDSRKYDSVYQEKEYYKSCCEKVSEIIKKEKKIMGYAKYDSCLLLIENILQNRSDSQ